MRIGVRIPQYGSTWAEIVAAAGRIEKLGFDGVWVNDHLQSPGRLKAEPTFDGLTTLAALAPQTTRTRLGIAVLSASYRPAALAAKTTSVLDTISGGRLVVGLGTGSDREEHAAYGYPFGSPAERTAGLLTTLDVMQAMRDAPDGPAPNQPASRPPIWLAAHKPRLLRLAGQRADGIVAAFLEPSALAERARIADEARRAAGRDPLALCLYTFCWPTGPESDRWLAAEASALDTTPRAITRWLATTGVVAPAGELADRLGEFAAVGATDVVVALPSRLPLEALDALAESLAPFLST